MGQTPKFDVVVVGGGPAGSSAAATLAAAGVSVAVVDKAVFPRDKLCGGLISGRSRKILSEVFGTDCNPPIEVRSKAARFFFGDRLLNEIHDYKPIDFTSRRSFDHYLLGLAASRGAHVIQGVAVRGLSDDLRSVELGDGRSIDTRFVIGADGASSRIRKDLPSITMDRQGFAVGVEMEVPREASDRGVLDPDIYFGVVKWGYAWVFPKRDTLTVGVGGLAGANPDMRNTLDQFARLALRRTPVGPVRGHPVPFGNHLDVPGQDSVLLAGDAAGLVEPITGEGIAFAMQSGCFAARSIIDAVSGGRPEAALELYQSRYKVIASLFRDARLMRHLVFSSRLEPWFARALNASTGAIREHMDVLAGDADYRDYSKFLLRRAVLRLPKLMRTLMQPAPR